MTYQGRDVWEMLRTKSHAAFIGGPSISTAMIKTEVEASKTHGGWPVYTRLDAETRAALVVEMMLDRALEALRAHDQNEKQKREAKKQRAKARKGKRR